jgi:colanic acid biosynthesis glycosyl transferase WcaI
VLWLQDILPDGAASTGLVKAGRALQAARRFERAAYAAADRIIVISRTHEANLLSKGVPASKLVRIFNPATRTPEPGRAAPSTDAPRIFTMGNIGHSQGLDRVVHAFEACTHPAVRDARFVIAGHGVAVDDVRAEIRSDRVDLLGLVSDDELERELRRATIGLVSQRADIAEFNLPSKMCNLMAYGLPIVAAVRPDSEVARLVRESGAGWVTSEPTDAALGDTLGKALADPDERERRGEIARAFAQRNFDQARIAASFDEALHDVVADRRPRRVAHR